MNKLIYLLIFSIFTAFLPSPTINAQQSNSRFVYIFDFVDQNLSKIYETGQIETFSLGIDHGSFTSSNDLVISPNGQLIAYCVQEDVEGTFTRNGTFFIRDIENETTLISLWQGPIAGCSVTAFSPDGQYVALSLVYVVPFETNSTPSPTSPMWSLEILEVASGKIVQELTSNSEFAPEMEALIEFGFEDGIPTMARVADLQSDHVDFYAIPFVGRDGGVNIPLFRWNFANNVVTRIEGRNTMNNDYLPATEEFIYPALDDTLPSVLALGMMTQANVLQLETADGISTIYHSAERVVVRAQFVNDGEAILIQLMSGYDPEDPAGSEISTIRFEMLDRDGNIISVGDEYISYTQTKPIEGGFALLWIDHDPTKPELPVPYLEMYQDGELVQIWTEAPDPDAPISFGELVWASPTSISNNLESFPSR